MFMQSEPSSFNTGVVVPCNSKMKFTYTPTTFAQFFRLFSLAEIHRGSHMTEMVTLLRRGKQEANLYETQLANPSRALAHFRLTAGQAKITK
jgi:hypothetical protein